MQERLAYLGRWLERNGEAIYGTRTFRDGAQWTAGRRQAVDTSTNYRAKYDVEAITLHPAPGDARKEILFTRKGDILYAILPLYPRGALTIRDLVLAKGARVSLLGTTLTNLAWRKRKDGIEVSMPALDVAALPFDGATVLKIEGVAVQQDIAP
jgi:alpha-L-fucosidase